MKEKTIIILTSLGLTAFASWVFSEFLKKEKRSTLDYLTLSYTTSAVLHWAEFMVKTGFRLLNETEE